MQETTPSPTLKYLLEKWEIDSKLFKLSSDAYIKQVEALCKLNDMINQQAKAEGLTLEQIGRS